MAERIIPIEIEGDCNEKEDDNSNGSEKNLSKPMKQLSIKQKKPAVQVKTKNNENENYLKEFDIFEDRGSYTLPSSNIPEKIILVIDRAQDENYTSFVTNNAKCTPLSMLKRVIHLFVKLKHIINKNHEFAIVVLNENDASWVINFTSDLRRINPAIDRITECEVEDTFDLNCLFEEILNVVEIPRSFNKEIPPPYLIRTVLFYGRSYTIPLLDANENIKNFLENPFCVLDVLMTHEPVDKSNYCSQIFESLQNVDKKGYSYFFPVGRDTRRMHVCTGKLLGHPLQRAVQILQKV